MRRHNLKASSRILSFWLNGAGPMQLQRRNILTTSQPVVSNVALVGMQAKRFYSETNGICLKCATPVNQGHAIEFECSKCGNLLKIPSKVDFFKLLGLEQKFNLDHANLTQRFRKLQSLLHPDKFSNKHEDVQSLSGDWSSLVNKAYKTLLSPIKRGEYLLQLKGITIGEENTSVDKAFLMEMMERNEEVESANTNKQLADLLTRVQRDRFKCVQALEASLGGNDLEKAKANVITLRYLISLENSIKDRGHDLGIVL